jgi:hypothetical protein
VANPDSPTGKEFVMMIPYTVVRDGYVLHGAFESDLPGTESFEGPGQGDDNPVPGVNDLWRTDTGEWIQGTDATGTDAVFAYQGITEAQARAWLVANEHHEAAHRHFGA